MLIVIAIVSAIGFAFSTARYMKKAPKNSDWDDYNKREKVMKAMSRTFGLVFIITMLSIVMMAPECANEHVIDEEIEYFEQRNQKIENDVSRMVQEYMNHEKDTYTELKPGDSAITLIPSYPELKSDSLVEWQLKSYQENTDKLTELKLKKMIHAVLLM